MSDHKKYNTPLLKKIGLKREATILFLEVSTEVRKMMDEALITFDERISPGKKYDLIWIFTNRLYLLETSLKKLRAYIQPNGMIWVSWYKKSSRMATELNEDIIRDTALALDLVDVKVAAVDDQWSALKLVIPVSKRGF